MKPKEELGFNFDLINLCNQYHNSVLGAFFPGLLLSLMKKFSKIKTKTLTCILQNVANDRFNPALKNICSTPVSNDDFPGRPCPFISKT